jgi:hypothetical protein
MTVRFAATHPAVGSPLARVLARGAALTAANDNRALAGAEDLMLHAALRHFAAHGLGAAREARKQAEKAFFAGDRPSYDWWLGVCRTLDRQLAAQIDRKCRNS